MWCRWLKTVLMHLLWELNIYTVTYIVIKLRFLNICVRILIGSSIRIQKEKLIHALSSRRGIRRCSWSTALRSLGHIFFHAQCLLLLMDGAFCVWLNICFTRCPSFTMRRPSLYSVSVSTHASFSSAGSDSSIAGSDSNVLK